jgi:hypothetical protein
MRRSRSLITAAALALVLWLIWSRLHIVVFVAVPWWGLLIGAVLLFLAVDYVLGEVFRRRQP